MFPKILIIVKNITSLREIYRSFHNRSVVYAVKSGPQYIFEQKISSGQLNADMRQRDVLGSLQKLYEEIKDYSPGVSNRYFHTPPPKGLYIYGSVGAGKTMLMDVFYGSVKIGAKRRVHFNDFMMDVHSRIHAAKTSRQDHRGSSGKSHPWNPFKPVARDLIKRAWLLCFDEFQVTDIGDAMILKSIFTELFNNGMVMVATSNRVPDDLYKDGLQRSNFVPFIHVLKSHCTVVSLNGPDYRKKSAPGVGVRYFLTQTGDEKAEMDKIFQSLCAHEKQSPSARSFNILGRRLTFQKSCGKILYTTFSELCDKPLAASDYLEIAKAFDTILISNIPKMSLDNRNQLRRFILLIDTLYDRKVRIIVSAAARPESLFSESGSGLMTDRSLMDDLNIESGSENGKSSIFSGSEEVFAYNRTVSRLIEMSSDTYWKRNER